MSTCSRGVINCHIGHINASTEFHVCQRFKFAAQIGTGSKNGGLSIQIAIVDQERGRKTICGVAVKGNWWIRHGHSLYDSSRPPILPSVYTSCQNPCIRRRDPWRSDEREFHLLFCALSRDWCYEGRKVRQALRTTHILLRYDTRTSAYASISHPKIGPGASWAALPESTTIFSRQVGRAAEFESPPFCLDLLWLRCRLPRKLWQLLLYYRQGTGVQSPPKGSD